MKCYDSVFCDFYNLLYSRANTKVEYKCDVRYFHTTYEVNPGAYSVSGKPRTPLVPLTGLEVSKEANSRLAPPTVSFDK